MALPAGTVSANLLAAQERLMQLQATSRQHRLAAGLPVDQHNAAPATASLTTAQVATRLPDHLGWGSAAVTAVARQTRQPNTPTTANVDWPLEPASCEPPPDASSSPPLGNDTLKLYPDIAIGLFSREQTAPGRIWLLLRHLDSKGCGWLDLSSVREQLATKGSAWRVCGWRQLRNLLNQGEGVFWVRANGRLWLRSVANVAAALQVPRLVLPPVALPVTALTLGIGQVRAHLYASFHSSRGTKTGTRPAAPIARATIASLTHVQPRAQRRYEKSVRVRSKRHFAIGDRADAQVMENAAWQRGNALFTLMDKKGKQGSSRQRYVAWQLPNSYTGPHKAQPKGQQKRINQALSDLFMQGMTGNGHGRLEKRYYGHGRAAAAAYSRGRNHEIYWYDGRLGAWYCLAPEGRKK